jgi:hypothetical protein
MSEPRDVEQHIEYESRADSTLSSRPSLRAVCEIRNVRVWGSECVWKYAR